MSSRHARDGQAPTDPAAAALEAHDVLCVRAPNPGPLTLSGTNTWVVGREPAWVVDPGPVIEEHLVRVLAALDARGGLGGVALTHDHPDHADGVRRLLDERPAPLAGGRGDVDVTLGAGVRFGPFEALPTPGHAEDHFALLAGGACFTGDAVLGEGSVFITPYPGALAGYMRGLGALRERGGIEVLCPGHGPAVGEVQAKLDQYLSHRREREQHLIAALGEGRRSTEQLLDAAWPDVPLQLRPLAAVTLAAHLDKLEEEQLLPEGVERPRLQIGEW